MKNILEKVVYGAYHDPFRVLGVHEDPNNRKVIYVRTFQPHAKSVSLLLENATIEMDKIHPEGLFEAKLSKGNLLQENLPPFSYQYEITFHDNNISVINDPYRFLPQLSEDDTYLFNQGTNYRLYDHLGSHHTVIENVEGVLFRLWAPAAKRVSVVGAFNSWDGRVHPCRSLGSSGVWELFIPGLPIGELYKFEVKTQEDKTLLKSDPLQFFGEVRPNTASIIYSLDGYTWNDQEWEKNKVQVSPYNQPLSIYEVHAGSWQRDPNEPERFLTLKELTTSLIPHVKKLGFTHIELMPVMEHPLDESWGYQVTAPFSFTSRYGIPEDFMYFVDQCHQNNIGVILDWVPAHFPRDSHSLARFDGTFLYEHEDPRRGAHPEWGTHIFNYGRREVSNFLLSNALFWIEKYHIDGLRVDAVSSMLYLDYARKEGEWIPNEYGGRENLEAIEFFRHLNSIVYEKYPGTLMIAEESTSFYGVSKPADVGGLGFGFKWNMGWMNDTLSYFQKDPIYRKYHHNNLTFSIMYAFSENFILPLSHDEVVHGKRSLIEKMPGDLWQKFANLRLLFTLMWCHPGKKLLFMGGEFGQYNEWFCKISLDWHLMNSAQQHTQLMQFVSDLNHFYRNESSLYQMDFNGEGFKWLDFEDREHSIISFARYNTDKSRHTICIFNFTPETFYDYKIGLCSPTEYIKVLCSDDIQYGGSGAVTEKKYTPYDIPYAQAPCHTTITVPPLAGILLQPNFL